MAQVQAVDVDAEDGETRFAKITDAALDSLRRLINVPIAVGGMVGYGRRAVPMCELRRLGVAGRAAVEQSHCQGCQVLQ